MFALLILLLLVMVAAAIVIVRQARSIKVLQATLTEEIANRNLWYDRACSAKNQLSDIELGRAVPDYFSRTAAENGLKGATGYIARQMLHEELAKRLFANN